MIAALLITFLAFNFGSAEAASSKRNGQITMVSKLTMPQPSLPSDQFGLSVASCKSLMAVSKVPSQLSLFNEFSDDDATANNPYMKLALGAVYIFITTISMTEPVAVLSKPDFNTMTSFGISLAITEGFIFVGGKALYADVGYVYIFRKVSGYLSRSWEFWDKISFNIKASHRLAATDEFLIISSTAASSDVGEVLVFNYDESALKWNLMQKLTASSDSSHFGSCLAIAKDEYSKMVTLAISNRHNSGKDFVNVYGLQLDTFSQFELWSSLTANVVLNGTDTNSLGSFLNFGYSIALSTGWLSVAATKVSNGVPSGCVYIFSIKYPSSSKIAVINQTQILESVEPTLLDQFGQSLVVADEILLIGAPYADGSVGQSGAVFVYTPSKDTWKLIKSLSAYDPKSGSLFAASMSYNYDYLWVGASGAGAIYSILSESIFSDTDYEGNGEGVSVVSVIILLVILPLLTMALYYMWSQQSEKEKDLHMSLRKETKSRPMSPAVEKQDVTLDTPYESPFMFKTIKKLFQREDVQAESLLIGSENLSDDRPGGGGQAKCSPADLHSQIYKALQRGSESPECLPVLVSSARPPNSLSTSPIEIVKTPDSTVDGYAIL